MICHGKLPGPFNGFVWVCLFCLLGLSHFSCRKNPDNEETTSGHIHGIIPLPKSVDFSDETLLLRKDVNVIPGLPFPTASAEVGNALSDALGITVSEKQEVNGINIRFNKNSALPKEGYRIDINGKEISVEASDAAGAFYASQSLRQMIINASGNKRSDTIRLRQMTIRDQPEYPWRGFHLDVSRHFFTRDYIFRIIDWLSFYKLNVLHLHLTDDQGWRIQLDQFPALTETGGWRTFNRYDSTCMSLASKDINYTLDQRFIREQNGVKEYGGFWTKQDIRDIIAYAGDHYIDVVPEIDMPGHMSAAIKAYPYLSCADSAGWGKEFSYPICPCKEEVMSFAAKVWDEIAELFPSKYVHIGSDEVEKDTWASSDICKAFMQANNFKNISELQNYFVKEMQKQLELKGKTVIAWDDVIEGSVDSKLLLMYWRDWVTDSPDRCAANGNDIILTPWSPFYLSSAKGDEAIEKLYNFKPSDLYPVAVVAKIRGMQTCMWTEEVPSEAIFEYLAFPGMEALSEICWTTSRNWYSFQQRMKSHFSWLDSQKINYRRPLWTYPDM